MLDIARGTTKGGRRTAFAGIVAALAAPSAVVMGNDLLMVVATFAFCILVIMGRNDPRDDIVLYGAAGGSAISLICVPAATGTMQFFLALAFSCGCVSIAALTGWSGRARSPDRLDVGAI